MRALQGVMRKLLGLFVDDGALAVLALVWIGLAWSVLPLALPPVGCAVLLFAGLAGALAFSVARA